MKKRMFGIVMLALTALAAAAAVILRFVMVNTEMTDGVVDRGAWTPMALMVSLGLVAAVLAVLTSRLARNKSYEATLGGSGWTALAGVTGAVIVLCHVMQMVNEPELGVLNLITCVTGIVGGVGLLVHMALRAAGRRSSLWTMIPLCLWTILSLICNYQSWSRDPVVAHYCFSTLADAAGMLMVYHVAAFVQGKGKRRMAALWSCLTVVFCLPALMDQPLKAGVESGTVSVLIITVAACAVVGCGLRWLVGRKNRFVTGCIIWSVTAIGLLLPVLLTDAPEWSFEQFGIRYAVLAMAMGSALCFCLRSENDPSPESAPEEPAEQVAADEEA